MGLSHPSEEAAQAAVSKDAPLCTQMKPDYAPLQRDLAEVGYIADEALAMALCLMIGLGRPLLIEGEAGVGKTEIGKALAQVLETRLIRLQCHEGLDAHA